MFCLAGIDGRVNGIMKTNEAAAKVVAIDGGPLNFARKTLEQAGFTDFTHVQLADLEFAKGESPVTEERVLSAAMAVAPRFGTQCK